MPARARIRLRATGRGAVAEDAAVAVGVVATSRARCSRRLPAVPSPQRPAMSSTARSVASSSRRASSRRWRVSHRIGVRPVSSTKRRARVRCEKWAWAASSATVIDRCISLTAHAQVAARLEPPFERGRCMNCRSPGGRPSRDGPHRCRARPVRPPHLPPHHPLRPHLRRPHRPDHRDRRASVANEVSRRTSGMKELNIPHWTCKSRLPPASHSAADVHPDCIPDRRAPLRTAPQLGGGSAPASAVRGYAEPCTHQSIIGATGLIRLWDAACGRASVTFASRKWGCRGVARSCYRRQAGRDPICGLSPASAFARASCRRRWRGCLFRPRPPRLCAGRSRRNDHSRRSLASSPPEPVSSAGNRCERPLLLPDGRSEHDRNGSVPSPWKPGAVALAG